MKCLYWNTKKTEDVERITDLLYQESPDLFFLSEIDPTFIEQNIEFINIFGYEHFKNPGCEKVLILKKIRLKASLGLQNYFYTVIKIDNLDLYIISIHLPSQMFMHMDALKEFIRNFRIEIDLEVGNSLEKKILIIGDFNVNPYEKPMIDYDGFLATNSINSRERISFSRQNKSTYYNPTWQLYNRKHFPGTKHFPRPSASSYDIIEFHFLDQAVISQCLLNNITYEKIEVIEQTENFCFLCEKNKIMGSDHLPLLYQFNLK